MRCEACNALINPQWTECRACGAALLPPVQVPLSERIAAAGVPNLAQAIQRLPRPSAGFSTRASQSTRRWGDTIRRVLPGSRVPIAALALLVLAALIGQQLALRSAWAAETAAESRVATLEASDRTARQARATLVAETGSTREQAAALTAERDALSTRLTAAEGEITRLRGELDTTTTRAATQETEAARQRGHAETLAECLSGTRVALEFGRAGGWSAADRAIVAVAAACAAAQPPRP